MGRKFRTKPKKSKPPNPRPKIDYPPVPTRKWVPPEQRKKPPKPEPKYAKPEGVSQKLAISTLKKCWHLFEIVGEAAIILGHFSQKHRRFTFKSNDLQGACICAVACAYQKLFKMETWDPYRLDEIIIQGDKLYIKSTMQGDKCLIVVTPEKMFTSFWLGSYKITLQTDQDGKIKQNLTAPSEEKSKEIMENTISKFLEKYESGIVSIKENYAAFWIQDGAYYLFDSSEHDQLGNPYVGPPGYGLSLLARYKKLRHLVDCVFRNFPETKTPNAEFELLGCGISRIVQVQTKPPETFEDIAPQEILWKPEEAPAPLPNLKLEALKSYVVLDKVDPDPVQKMVQEMSPYVSEDMFGEGKLSRPSFLGDAPFEKLDEGRYRIPVPTYIKRDKTRLTYYVDVEPNQLAILRGNTSQTDPNFSKYGGRQSMGNALSALVMLRLYKSKYWIPSFVDFILQQGDLLYQEAMKSIPRTRSLRLTDFPKKLEYKGQFFEPEIDEYALMGQLNSQDFEVLDLGPALEFFLSEYECCIIIGPLTLAVWIEDGLFYMFDPNERDQNGKALPKKDLSMLTSEDTPIGVACVIRFQDLKKLTELYIQNTEKSKREDRFYLSRIKIKDYCEVPDDWYHFKGLCLGKWILQGSFYQGSYRFPPESRNFQSTANAFMSLAMLALVGLEDWNTEIVDELLTIGDEFYRSSVQHLQEKNLFANPMLMVSELKKFQRLRDKEANFEVEECAENGLIFARKEDGLPSLFKGLERFFRDNNTGVITSREVSLAIWKKDNYYYYFDPFSRDSRGLPTGYGTSCVIRTQCLEDFAKFIEFNLDPNTEDTYNIANVKITLYEASEEGIVKPPLNNYTKINEKSAILRSWLSDTSDIFDSYRKGRQTIPMCFIAVGFNKLKPSIEWTKNDLDEILLKGDSFYVDCMAEEQKKLLEEFQAAIPEISHVEESPQDPQGGGDAKLKPEPDIATSEPEEKEAVDEIQEDIEEAQEPELEAKITSENVKTIFTIGPNNFNVEFLDTESVQVTPPIKDTLIETIKAALEKSQVDPDDEMFSNEILLESKNYSVIMWRDDKAYYVFDPKPRDKTGQWIGNEDWDPEPEPEPTPRSSEEATLKTEGESENEYGNAAEEVDQEASPEVLDDDQTFEERLEEKPLLLDEEPKDKEDEDNQDNEKEENEEVAKELEEEQEDKAELVAPPKLKKSPSYWAEQEKNGRACTIWFLSSDDVANYIYNNFPPKDRAKGQFQMIHLKIINTLKLKNKWDPEDQMNSVYDGDWYDFREIDHGMWIIRASCDLTCPIFPERNRGKQTLTTSLIALAIKHLYELTCFVSTTPDTMLMYGDKLYSYLRKLRKRQWMEDTNSKLGEDEIDWLLDHYDFQIQDIPKRICISKFMVEVTIKPNVISGDTKAQDFEEVLDVKRGLEKFFDENKYGILEAKGLFVAVWRGIKIYYMFDGLKRGPNGIQSAIGVGCITRYLDLDKMAEIFCANLPEMGNNQFLIHKVLLSRDLCPREREPREPMPVPKTVQKSAVLKIVIPGKCIVRGGTSQEDPKFGKMPGMMSAPIAIIALTMTLIHKPEIWCRPIIDEIIVLGAELYEESTNALNFDFNPWEDTLDIYRVKNDYKLGVLKANCELRHTDQRGIIDIKDPVIKNLRQGIENFFEENTHGILVTEPLTLAIWEQRQDNGPPLIYIFDPNPRGATGMPLFNGAACAVSFVNAKLAADHIIGCILDPDKRSAEYTIVPVEIVVEGSIKTPNKLEKSVTRSSVNTLPRCSKLVASEQKRVLRKLAQDEHKKKELKRLSLIGRQGYHSIKGGEAILRGYNHQNSECYSQETRGNQDIPNCIVAVVMHTVLPIDEWNHRHIDIILDTGNQLYIDSYIAYCPHNVKIGMENIMRKFVMTNLKVHVTIYKPIITADFKSSKLTEVLDVFFQQEPVCLLNFKDNWITVFFKAGYFYMFDPHERDINGDPIRTGGKQGTAVVIRFKNLTFMAKKIHQNLGFGNIENENPEEENMFSLWIVAVETRTQH